MVFFIPLSNEKGYPLDLSPGLNFSEIDLVEAEGTYADDSRNFKDQDMLFSIMLNHLHEHLIFIPRSELKIIISSVINCSNRYSVTPELIFSLIHTESSFNSKAISRKGAIGLMQIMPSTAEGIARELDIEWSGIEMLYDPATNIEFGTYYLHNLVKNFNDIDSALTAYNIGPTRLSKMIGESSLYKSSFSSLVKKRSEELAFGKNTKSI